MEKNKKNIYFIINRIFIRKNDDYNIVIKNIFNDSYNIFIDDIHHYFTENSIIDQNIIKNKFLIKVKYQEVEEEFNFNLDKLDPKGFGENCLVETPDGQKFIKDLNSGDFILSKYGDKIKISNVFIYSIDKGINSKPIIIEKSKCGMNLPYSDIILSIKTNLKIKKVVLKGRSLFLNGKAKLFQFNDKIDLYSLETENNQDYFLSGFIVESI